MIAAILAGKTELYHELIRPHERSIYRMALSLMKNEADAEDVAQEAVLKGLRSLKDFRGQAKFSTWLISITLNEARGRLRHAKVLRMESLDIAPDEGGHIAPALLREWREVPSAALERKEVRFAEHSAEFAARKTTVLLVCPGPSANSASTRRSLEQPCLWQPNLGAGCAQPAWKPTSGRA